MCKQADKQTTHALPEACQENKITSSAVEVTEEEAVDHGWRGCRVVAALRPPVGVDDVEVDLGVSGFKGFGKQKCQQAMNACPSAAEATENLPTL